jgi:cytochrome P450
MLGGFGPMADWYYFTLFHVINNPECYKILVDEIRTEFLNYDDISVQSTANLHYLIACLNETLRIISTNSTGLPRYSPEAVVDGYGYCIPKGVSRSFFQQNLAATVTHSLHSGDRSEQHTHSRPEC